MEAHGIDHFALDNLDETFDSEYFDLDLCEWDVSDISLDSEEHDHQSRQKRKLTELQQSYKLRRPRIVKSDFRRVFPQIWAGVFNSTDYDTMRNHINTFYDGGVCLLQQDLRPAELTQVCSMSRGPLVGHDNLSDFWFRSMNIAPDLVCTLKHTYVKVRSNGTSSIKCTFGLSGTKVIAVEGNHDLSEANKVVNLRPVHANEETEGNELDRFVSLSGFNDAESNRSLLSTHSPDLTTANSSDSSISTNESANSLQEVLQRYLKSSDAMSRAKAQAREAKGKGHKRRRRGKNADFVQEVPVEEWLSASTEDMQAEESNLKHLHITSKAAPFTQHAFDAYVANGTVCISRVNHLSLRGDNDRVSPITRAYNVQHGQQGEVLLSAPFEFTCCVDMNFNADHRIESLCVNYLD